MDRRLDIKRTSSSDLKDSIAEMLKSDIVQPRTDRADVLLDILDNVDINRATYPQFPRTGYIFCDDVLQKYMDAVYLDYSIMYNDFYTLSDYIESISSEFRSTILSMLEQTSGSLTKLKDLYKLDGKVRVCTDIYHNTFNRDSNVPVSGNKLKVNHAAGIVTLGYTSDNICTPEETDIEINPISDGVNLIDRSNISGVYTNDPTSPAYVAVASTSYPSNLNSGNRIISHITGMTFDIHIKFPSIVPVNSISFSPFSNGELTVDSLFYSALDSPLWIPSQMTEITLSNYSNDNTVIELNFQRVYAKEIHIIVYQSGYVIADSDVAINRYSDINEYINYVSEAIYQGLNSGVTPGEDLDYQLSDIKAEIVKYMNKDFNIIPAGSRIYTAGCYNMKIEDRDYNTYGKYTDSTLLLEGSLLNVGMEYDGIPVPVINDVPAGTTIIEINTNGRTIPMVETIDSDPVSIFAGIPIVIDIGEVLEYNNTSYLKTNFIPKSPDEIVIYSDGIESLPVPVESIKRSDNGIEIELPSEYADQNELYVGKYLCIGYVPAEYDFNGREYSTDYIDIPNRIGIPNIDNNRITGFIDQYIYTYSGDNPDEFISYNLFECEKIIYDEEEYYFLGSGKGETESDWILTGIDNVIAKTRNVIGPVDDFYIGIIDEPVSISVNNENGYDIYETEYNYIKGTLKVLDPDTDFYIDVIEYETDTIDTKYPKDRFKISTASGYGDLLVSYIPIKVPDEVELKNNIAPYNFTESFSRTKDKTVELSFYPSIDSKIISSDSFNFLNGIFSLKYSYSITYEPISVMVNGSKATDMTDYKTGIRPSLPVPRNKGDISFYISDGNKLTLNSEVEGVITVSYYKYTDRMAAGIRMIKCNNISDDVSPELYNYTLAVNIRRV